MSNKNKSQQQHHKQPGQQQQQQSHQGSGTGNSNGPVPPRYQPPPQPGPGGILKHHQAGLLREPQQQPGTGILTLHQQQQLHQLHQQQAARLASQVKDAVQSKFSQKVDLPYAAAAAAAHSSRAEKLQTGYNLQHHQQQKSYLGPGIPTPSTTPTAGANVAGPTVSVGGVQGGPRQRLPDEEFLRLGPLEMLKFVRKTEGEMARLAAEQHRQIQSLVNELRTLKEANQRLSDDNQELRDLCCFLDDDRQKGRKLAREWQRFGRYTASVMRQEVSAYQNKLRQLDNKQQELIKDNLELKELCLYLDEERGGGQRDDGDGSSSSTNADETAPAPPRLPRHPHHAVPTFNDQTMQYVRSLEQRVKQLEEDKNILQARTQSWPTGPNEVWENPRSPSDDFHLGSRPEAVVRALQVLEVREQLEREAGHAGEKALVREMCNVVWRKLEEEPAQNRQ